MNRTRVLVADAQHLFAECLAASLRRWREFDVLAQYPTNGQDTVKAVVQFRPAVVLADFWLPGMNGPAVSRAIATWSPGPKVLILSWFHGPLQVQEALEAGVVGFLPKGLDLARVAEAVRGAARGESLVFAQELFDLVGSINRRAEIGQERWDRLMTLSSREVEILQGLCTGRPAKLVARDLSIAMGTLKNHIHNILVKTGAETKLEAISIARSVGLIGELNPGSEP